MHTLIIPKRRCQNLFELGQSEINACIQILQNSKLDIEGRDKKVEGSNLGVNSGQIAGQTILNTHIHLIPRRVGDVKDPRGGIRHVIPGMGDY